MRAATVLDPPRRKISSTSRPCFFQIPLSAVTQDAAKPVVLRVHLPADAVGLALDTYPLNIEEQDPAAAVRRAGAAGRLAP